MVNYHAFLISSQRERERGMHACTLRDEEKKKKNVNYINFTSWITTTICKYQRNINIYA